MRESPADQRSSQVCRVWGFAGLLVLSACGGQREKKVLVIGLDGVTVDILAEAVTPHIDSLAATGVFSSSALTRNPTVSGPGWSSMLTGVWGDKHGVSNNSFEGSAYNEYPDLLTRLERIDSSFNTFAVVDWPPLGTLDAGPALIGDAIDVKVMYDGETDGYVMADSQSVVAAVEHLTNEDPDAVFVYLGNIDVVAHATSSLAPEYRASIEAADIQVGRLLEAMRSRPTYSNEDWLVLMSTDHGRSDDGGHGGTSLQERTVFFLASGSATDRGILEPAPNIVDIAVTALKHLQVEIDSAWGLDGEARGLHN